MKKIRRSVFGKNKLKVLALTAVLALAVMSMPAFHLTKHGTAACTPPATTIGLDTLTINIPSAATYRFWTRMQAADATNNSYTLQVDQTNCNITVGDNTNISSSALSWIDYQSGTVSNKIDLTLTAGNHTFYLYGKEDSVIIDKVLLTADTACVPTGNGDNCNPVADTTPPTVTLTAPTNNATVTGSINLTATASDNVGVAKVDFLVDNNVVSSDTTSPYSFSWNSASVTNATHTIKATATDTSNLTTSSQVTVTVNNPTVVAPVVTLSAAPASIPNGSSSTLTWSTTGTSPTCTASGGWTGTKAASGTQSVSPTATASYTLTCTNSAGSNAKTATVTVTAAQDTTPPTVNMTAPADGANLTGGSQTVTGTASDNVGVQRVEFYVNNVLTGTDTTSPYSFTWNTASLSNGSYTLKLTAFDAANLSTSSTHTVSLVVTAAKPGDCNGDNAVDIFDLSILLSNYGQSQTGYSFGDFNGDGKVDVFDLSIQLSNYGK